MTSLLDDPRNQRIDEFVYAAEAALAQRLDADARAAFTRAAELETELLSEAPDDAPRLRAMLTTSAVTLWWRAEHDLSAVVTTLCEMQRGLPEDAWPQLASVFSKAAVRWRAVHDREDGWEPRHWARALATAAGDKDADALVSLRPFAAHSTPVDDAAAMRWLPEGWQPSDNFESPSEYLHALQELAKTDWRVPHFERVFPAALACLDRAVFMEAIYHAGASPPPHPGSSDSPSPGFRWAAEIVATKGLKLVRELEVEYHRFVCPPDHVGVRAA